MLLMYSTPFIDIVDSDIGSHKLMWTRSLNNYLAVAPLFDTFHCFFTFIINRLICILDGMKQTFTVLMLEVDFG